MSETTMESTTALRSACDGCISRLQELVKIHLVSDPGDRTVEPNVVDYILRMRKVLHHAKAIAGWTLDTDVMHVMAPEIREALDQIDRVWEEAAHDLELDEMVHHHRSKAMSVRAKAHRAGLSAYVHPSPSRLLLGKEDGGLLPSDDRRYYAIMLDLLFEVTFRYAISLAYLSRRFDDSQLSSIASVVQRLGTSLPSAMSMNPTGGDLASPR